MMKVMSMVVILAVLLLSLATAGGQVVDSCDDGRLSECKYVLDEVQYAGAQLITQCMSELGMTHDFSEGATSPITLQTCLLNDVQMTNNSELMKCFGRKAGFVITINGIDQWDTSRLRSLMVRTTIKEFPLRDRRWIRDMLINDLLSCPTKSRDFKVFPYIDCIEEAVSKITFILQNNRRTPPGTLLVWF